VLVKLRRDDEALQAFATALKLSPGDEEIQRQMRELEAAKTVRSDIFQELFAIKGIGKTRAKALIDAGFRTAEDLANASLKDLLAVRGITRTIAEELRRHFRPSPAAVTRASS
jgi:helicase